MLVQVVVDVMLVTVERRGTIFDKTRAMDLLADIAHRMAAKGSNWDWRASEESRRVWSATSGLELMDESEGVLVLVIKEGVGHGRQLHEVRRTVALLHATS